MRQIDAKYKTSGDITKLDGTPIPDDEPLILFRAQDKLLTALLEYYNELCQQAGSPEEQLERVRERVELIREWQERHSTKVPD